MTTPASKTCVVLTGIGESREPQRPGRYELGAVRITARAF